MQFWAPRNAVNKFGDYKDKIPELQYQTPATYAAGCVLPGYATPSRTQPGY